MILQVILDLSNTEKPTTATSQAVTLINHACSSKNQIQIHFLTRKKNCLKKLWLTK